MYIDRLACLGEVSWREEHARERDILYKRGECSRGDRKIFCLVIADLEALEVSYKYRVSAL